MQIIKEVRQTCLVMFSSPCLWSINSNLNQMPVSTSSFWIDLYVQVWYITTICAGFGNQEQFPGGFFYTIYVFFTLDFFVVVFNSY